MDERNYKVATNKDPGILGAGTQRTISPDVEGARARVMEDISDADRRVVLKSSAMLEDYHNMLGSISSDIGAFNEIINRATRMRDKLNEQLETVQSIISLQESAIDAYAKRNTDPYDDDTAQPLPLNVRTTTKSLVSGDILAEAMSKADGTLDEPYDEVGNYRG